MLRINRHVYRNQYPKSTAETAMMNRLANKPTFSDLLSKPARRRFIYLKITLHCDEYKPIAGTKLFFEPYYLY